jgi:hypothetical protein
MAALPQNFRQYLYVGAGREDPAHAAEPELTSSTTLLSSPLRITVSAVNYNRQSSVLSLRLRKLYRVIQALLAIKHKTGILIL